MPRGIGSGGKRLVHADRKKKKPGERGRPNQHCPIRFSGEAENVWQDGKKAPSVEARGGGVEQKGERKKGSL